MMRVRDHSRRFARAPVALEVQYRTKGSFLISYSLNLSKGGLFLETEDLLPVGTSLVVRFAVPGIAEPIETRARVQWIRHAQAAIEQRPAVTAGVGLAFDDLDAEIGEQIDRMVRGFSGVRLLVVATEKQAYERLARNLRSVMSCTVLRASSAEELEDNLQGNLDLVLVELDACDVAQAAIRAAIASRVPVIGLGRDQQRAESARQAGVNAILTNPTRYEVLRDEVFRILGKPIA